MRVLIKHDLNINIYIYNIYICNKCVCIPILMADKDSKLGQEELSDEISFIEELTEKVSILCKGNVSLLIQQLSF